MAELLVKAIDHCMPTVAEWRARVTVQAAEAQAFLAANPRVEEAIAIKQRVEAYVSAKQRVVADASAAPEKKLPALERIELTAAVASYEAKPVAPVDLQMAVAAHYTKPEKRQVIDGASVQVEAEVPSLVTMHHWHKGVIEDSLKDDATKAVELETKDRQGCYKRGYVVAVCRDGMKWGNEERLPKFVVIKRPGVPVDDPTLQQLMQSEPERRRQYQIQFDSFPAEALKKLDGEGVLTVDKDGDLDWDTFIGCVFDHKAGAVVKANG